MFNVAIALITTEIERSLSSINRRANPRTIASIVGIQEEWVHAMCIHMGLIRTYEGSEMLFLRA